MKKILYLLPLVFLGCGHGTQNNAVSPVSVEVVEVALTSGTHAQQYIGMVEEEFASSLSFSVPGSIVKLYVGESNIVKEGALLAEIDNSSYQSSYEAAAAQLRQAEDGYRRMKELYEKGSLTEVQWVEMQTNLEKARSMEQISRKNLESTKLYAPFSGLIGKQSMEMGMNAMPGMPVFSLLKMDKVNVTVAIPEYTIATIYQGQEAEVVVPALSNAAFKGKVTKKGVVAHPISHTYQIEISLNNQGQQLIPGMVCHVKLQSKDSTEAIILPNQAVKLSEQGEHFVWLATEGHAKKQVVKTGALSSKGIVITHGLATGDKVIVKGNQKVSEGTSIKVL